MSKRVLVFGGSGMLGRRVVDALRKAGHMVTYPLRSSCRIDVPFDLEIAFAEPVDVVINCAGAISSRVENPAAMILANALGPNLVAQAAVAYGGGAKVIHISTDCVFSGVPNLRMPGRRYSVDNPAAATDFYGRSKALGEVQAPHVTNVRTSFIGPEHGLWAWLASQPDGATVEGWENAFWTGSTADAVAEAIAELAENPPGGTVHLATEEKVSKLDVLLLLKKRLSLGVKIKPTWEPRIDRALEPTIVLPSLQEALLGLGKERVRS